MSATASTSPCAQTGRTVRVLLLIGAAILSAAAARAQDLPPVPSSPAIASATPDDESSRASRTARFLLGGAAGLGLHEGGHVLFDAVFGVEPTLKKVDFGGIPFFAITHPAGQPPRREFVISSAGFWIQELSSEIVLVRHPRLRDEASPTRKGLLAFNVLASVAYGCAAFAKAGPAERDTRAMAASLGVDEAWVGALVLVPAGLDAWRYFHPESRWARWLSCGVKVGGVLLVLK